MQDKSKRKVIRAFQYPLADRVGFWGPWRQQRERGHVVFQYPLADRVGFWGYNTIVDEIYAEMFQYPLADRVGFWGYDRAGRVDGKVSFSILLRIELVFGAHRRCCFLL